MTNLPQWGDPIPANGKRPEWLRDDEAVFIQYGRGPEYDYSIKVCHVPWQDNARFAFRLPANHWAYPVLAKGFTPWAGGFGPPEGFTEGEVLYLGGDTETVGRLDNDGWRHEGEFDDIIGYRQKKSSTEETRQRVMERFPNTMTHLAKRDGPAFKPLTEKQWREEWEGELYTIQNDNTAFACNRKSAAEIFLSILHKHGLVAPEPTLFEKFRREPRDKATIEWWIGARAALKWVEDRDEG